MNVHSSEMESLAQKLWGAPNARMSTREDVRYGTNGSKSLRPKAGEWFDHEAGEGGGYADLYAKVHGKRPDDPDIAAIYDYCDPNGRLLYQVVRKVPKTFRQRQSDGNGGWIWNLQGIKRVLYRLPELLAADPIEPVFIPEGEKDVDALRERGLISTTNPGGAGKWLDSYSPHLRGRHVIVLPDNDQAGRDHAADLEGKLKPIAASVRVLSLPNLPEKGDVSDWLAAGGNAELLVDMLTATDDDHEHRPEDEPNPNEHAGPDDTAGSGLRTFLSITTWIKRDIPPPDRLLGDLFTTTTRTLLIGATGLGKTMVGLAAALAMATGTGFLHWKAGRPSRVLYIDGEMPAELIKSRCIDALRRARNPDFMGELFIFGRDLEEEAAQLFPSLGKMEPLNTEAGQNWLLALIATLGGVDVVILDNVMSLTTGDKKEEATWNDVLPLVASLTTKRIGQLWIDHSGHDASRVYGTSTKSWRFDTVGIMAPLSDEQRRGADVAFALTFTKARRRTPDNRADFEPATIRLEHDCWVAEGQVSSPQGKVPPTRVPFYDALVSAISKSPVGIGRTMLGTWELECLRRGLIERPADAENYRQRDARYRAFRKAKSDLLAAKWIGMEDDMVLDLRGRWG